MTTAPTPRHDRLPAGDTPHPRGTWIIRAVGEIDVDTADSLHAALATAARTYPVVVLDAAEVTFADSSFVNAVVRAHRRTRLRIARPSPQVRHLLELTTQDRHMPVYTTLAEAVEG
ncbi:STAS domain-containing protein [Streptomyces sp. NPDC060194]|uniref:STAS domain-containing protein n=1 Tax=Streptomyces sp. NPDC060194 TaxID=3347069 RepID=UPI0036641995